MASSFDFDGWLGRASRFAVIGERGFHRLDDPEAIAAYREGNPSPGPGEALGLRCRCET